MKWSIPFNLLASVSSPSTWKYPLNSSACFHMISGHILPADHPPFTSTRLSPPLFQPSRHPRRSLFFLVSFRCLSLSLHQRRDGGGQEVRGRKRRSDCSCFAVSNCCNLTEARRNCVDEVWLCRCWCVRASVSAHQRKIGCGETKAHCLCPHTAQTCTRWHNDIIRKYLHYCTLTVLHTGGCVLTFSGCTFILKRW